MSNMGYCRFENTLLDLRDCYEYMDEKLSGNEARARERLIKLCECIAKEYGETEEQE